MSGEKYEFREWIQSGMKYIERDDFQILVIMIEFLGTWFTFTTKLQVRENFDRIDIDVDVTKLD